MIFWVQKSDLFYLCMTDKCHIKFISLFVKYVCSKWMEILYANLKFKYFLNVDDS